VEFGVLRGIVTARGFGRSCDPQQWKVLASTCKILQDFEHITRKMTRLNAGLV
jgi:hypothetical protein